MFESDDFDQVLSQFEIPEDITNLKSTINAPESAKHGSDGRVLLDLVQVNTVNHLNGGTCEQGYEIRKNDDIQAKTTGNDDNNTREMVSHNKRKMIHSYFDHNTKRKFPGPAGLLTGNQKNKDETICHMELLSQDVNFSQNNLTGDLFESPLWKRLQDDLRHWNLKNIDSIKTVKQQAIAGSLRRRKAHTMTAFVEAVDRSDSDPLIIMRDTTGVIKGTLHRDAWSGFSQYIASEYCAFILWKPTILTTGPVFKKHYLNITLSNILAVYSSKVMNNEVENKALPDGYSIVYEDDYTVIKTENNIQNLGIDSSVSSEFDTGTNDLLDGLDSIFTDEVF